MPRPPTSKRASSSSSPPSARRRRTSTPTVAEIIAAVRARGDAALAEFSQRFDRVDVLRLGLKITPEEVDAALSACDPKAIEALKFAYERVLVYHRRQAPEDVSFTDALGVELGWRWRPIESVGLYVPGGAASYPSSVLMNAAPAIIAGCKRIAMVAPTPDGKLNPLVLAAARIAGVEEIYRVGGAQAVAALAYGTADDPAGGEDRRARQRLCGGGEAAGVWGRRHRHDRRALRGGGDRRRKRRSALRRSRPSGAGRTRRGRPIDSHHRRHAAGAQCRRRGDEAARRSAAAKDRGGELARLWRGHSGQRPRRGDPARRSPGARAPGDSGARRRCARGGASPTPARSSSDLIRPRRSAITSAARTMCCPPRARRVFLRASGSTTSSSALPSSSATLRALSAIGPAAVTLGEAESLTAHARSVAIRLADLGRAAD